MKYMSFLAACSYAGVANMLECFGVHAQDRQIALGMGHPGLFAREDGAYLAGPMLQSAKWFNLYLHTIGFHMEERLLPAEQVADYLRTRKSAMLGMKTGNGKHAVVFMGQQADRLVFLNNKRQNDPEPECLLLTEAELLDSLESSAMVAALVPIQPSAVDMAPVRRESAAALRANLEDIRRLCAGEISVAVLRERMDPLFRALLLDAITVLELAGESALTRELSGIQGRFLTALRREPGELLRLGDILPISALERAVEGYLRLIEHS